MQSPGLLLDLPAGQETPRTLPSARHPPYRWVLDHLCAHGAWLLGGLWQGTRICHPRVSLFGMRMIFVLIVFEKLQIQEKPANSISDPFVGAIYIERGALPGVQLCPHITSPDFRGGGAAWFTTDFLFWPSCEYASLPLQPRPSSLSLAQNGP